MKQLKFMLAAATAVGIAAAAQAADPLWTDTFEDGVLPAGYSYVPASDNDNDNESAIVEGGYNSSAKALKVNTGTNPLLRALDYDGKANAVDLTEDNLNYVYIDTMVQFTVTPDGDEVTASSTDDKLLIYLKEDLENERTNLVVRAAGTTFDEGGESTGEMAEDGVEYILNTTSEIVPNAWYRLVVKAKAIPVGSGFWPVFNIYLGGDTDDHQLYSDAEGGFETINEDVALNAGDFVSLQVTAANADGIAKGAEELALKHVGFAGEGMVDDLAFTKDVNAPTAADFTFTLSWGDGISAVTYTIAGEEAAKEPVNGQAFTVSGTGSFTISYTLDSWYTLNEANPTLTYDFAPNGSGSLNLATTKITSKEDGEGNVVVNPDASVTEIQTAAGITGGAFADANTSKDDLQSALNWKKNCNGKGKADINKITFSGVEPTSPEAEAYLLNCDPDELETAKESFKFPAIVPGQTPAIDDSQYNGTVTVKGKKSLSDAEWGTAEGANFFKAFLTK